MSLVVKGSVIESGTDADAAVVQYVVNSLQAVLQVVMSRISPLMYSNLGVVYKRGNITEVARCHIIEHPYFFCTCSQ